MKISVILAHPDEASFNHAIAKTAVEQLEANGHGVFFHDLYKENFDPLLTRQETPGDASLSRVVAEHCGQIGRADGIIVVHPN